VFYNNNRFAGALQEPCGVLHRSFAPAGRAGMVYLTGDTHGDIQRFKQGKLRWLGKKDTVVVLGDFGFVWDGSAAERKRLDWLRKRPYTILFLDGSHENYDLLHSTRRLNFSAAGYRALAAMCTMCAGAACWSWRARPISASAVRKVRIRTTGSRA
jgi:hypothetical protein